MLLRSMNEVNLILVSRGDTSTTFPESRVFPTTHWLSDPTVLVPYLPKLGDQLASILENACTKSCLRVKVMCSNWAVFERLLIGN